MHREDSAKTPRTCPLGFSDYVEEKGEATIPQDPGGFMRLRRRRSGFTVLELLVLLGVFLVVLALSLPALAKVREKANRARCADQLRRLGEACNAFEGTYGFFPFSIKELGPQRSWVVQILPWIGEAELARRYDYEKPWYDPANAAAVGHQVSLFYCPASPSGPRTASGTVQVKTTSPMGDRVVTSFPFAGAACTDYAVIHKVRTEAFTRGFVDKAGPGLLAEDLFPRRSDVPDGLANTLLIVESAARPDEWMVGRLTRHDILPADAPWASRDNDFSLRGFTWDPAAQVYSNAVSGPCAINCSNVEGMYSFHPGGAQAVFGDASVRFLSQTLTTRQLARLVTRAGGEPVDWSEY
jgi:competence protein ComGC